MENVVITIDTVLQVFGAVAVIGGGIKIIISAFSPFRELKQNILKINKKNEEQDNNIREMKDSLERIEDAQKIQGKALMELLNHVITGNHIDKLEKQYNDLVSHYINQ